MRKHRGFMVNTLIGLFVTMGLAGCADDNKLKLARCTVNKEVPIGGDFNLIDHHNNDITRDDLKGHFSILYFGFTRCPDVCPLSLVIIRDALDFLPKKTRSEFKSYLISLDPERDDPQTMKSYVENEAFAKPLIGLTGSLENIEKAASAFKIGFQKVSSNSEADYLIDHTSYIMVLDKEAAFLGFFSHGTPPEDIALCLEHYAR